MSRQVGRARGYSQDGNVQKAYLSKVTHPYVYRNYISSNLDSWQLLELFGERLAEVISSEHKFERDLLIDAACALYKRF